MRTGDSMIEALARMAFRRPVAVLVVALAVVLMGRVAWKSLPIDLLPDLQAPTVLVSISSGDRPPEEMERIYGETVEQRLFTVSGIRDIAEVARSGRLIARVSFEWGRSMDLAVVEVQKALGSLRGDPEVDELVVRLFDPRQAPIISFGMVAPSGQPNLVELKRLARRQLAPTLEQLEGVAQLRVIGGRELEVQLHLDPTRLDAFGLSVSEIRSRLAAANLDINAGTLQEGDQVFLVRGMARFRGPTDVKNVVLRYQKSADSGAIPVRVSDIGMVRMAPARVESLVRINGVEGVGIEVYKENGSNTVEVSRRLRGKLRLIEEDLPGVEFSVVGDDARMVESAISSVEGAALLGIFLALGVLVFFLRSAGPTLIVAAAVPVSLLAAVLAMGFVGRSLNLMTLGGLALGAGMLVDNAIVVVESIFRRRSLGLSLEDAAVSGTGRVAGAIIASTLTTCVVFLPVLFVHGLAARLVSGLAFSVILSLSASLLVALFLIPALSRWLLPLRAGRVIDPGAGRLESTVGMIVGHSGIVLLIAFLLSGAALWGLVRLGSRLLPPADPQQFAMRLHARPGLRVENTADLTTLVEEILHKAGGTSIEAVLSEIGRVPEDDRVISEEQREENTARVRVRLDPEGLPAETVIRRASQGLEALAGVDVQWETGSSLLENILGRRGAPIEVVLEGRQLEDLRQAADELRRRMAKLGGLWNVRSSFEGGPPELRLRLRRLPAEALGIGVDELAPVVEASLDGVEATRMTIGDEEYRLRIFLPPVTAAGLGGLQIRSSSGARVQLEDISRIIPFQGAREIYREKQQRVARVGAQVVEGASLPDLRRRVEEMLKTLQLPPGINAHPAGEEVQRRETLSELKWAGLLAMLLVLMVLAASFESLRHPLTVLSVIPLSLIGVAAVMIPRGQPLGVMAFLGLIVLAGVAVNDAILLVDAARRFRKEGLEKAVAVSRAASIRLRPILMTTATTVLALAPLAFGSGEAAALRAPLALCLIGGLLASTVASLFVIPCVFMVMER